MRPTPGSYFAFILSSLLAIACGGSNTADDDGDGGNGPDACVGIECNIVDCGAMQLPPTSISGTVFAPNGTLPLNGVNVYVPREALPPFVEGVTCDRCQTTLPGGPVVQAISDASGNFRLDNVPAGADIPLVITTGKWRRQIVIPSVTQCGDNAIGAAQTSLPKNKSEGDIPRIAITTGDADSLECLIRKLGIADSEIGKDGDANRIHLYTGNGTDQFKSGFPGATGAIPSATPFWSSATTLNVYDIVILSCEGGQNPGQKPQGSLDAMKAYADIGGRVFASHWHNIWVGGNFQDGNPDLAPAVWKDIATWDGGDGDPGDPVAIDETNNPKGGLFADWMINVAGSGPATSPNPTTRGQVTLQGNTRRATSVTLDLTKAERWVFAPQNNDSPQMFQFTTPNEVASDQRCGKVVFSDMHVSGGPLGGSYPDSCAAGDLTPQEKALAFMFFDIAGCVGGIF